MPGAAGGKPVPGKGGAPYLTEFRVTVARLFSALPTAAGSC
jgi:hypothetical protein